jgi:hypothetical protein
MVPIDSAGSMTDDDAAARPAGQVTVRWDPPPVPAAAAESADAGQGSDDFLAPGLEEAGYGYGV